MLDFSELPSDGTQFELLIREILFSIGYNVAWSGVGTDGGKDLLALETVLSPFGERKVRWLIQCKHFANSSRSVGLKDIDNIIDSCSQHDADGYLIVSSTTISSGVVNRLEAISQDRSKHLATNFWDAVAIERLLSSPETWPIAQRFMPRSANAIGFSVSSTTRPNQWIVNYKGHYIQLSNRIGSRYRYHFASITERIGDTEKIKLFDNQFFRIRSVFYNDKGGSYHYSIDYMIPHGAKKFYSTESLLKAFGNEQILEDGQYYTFDIMRVRYHIHSDHYDDNHYSYYVPYAGSFLVGEPRYTNHYDRSDDNSVKYDYDYYRAFSSATTGAYERLCLTLRSLKWIQFIRGENADFEAVDHLVNSKDLFNAAGSWSLKIERINSCLVVIRPLDEKKFTRMMSTLRQDLDLLFICRKGYTFIPHGDQISTYDDSDHLFFIEFKMNYYTNETPASLRSKFNQYISECIERIEMFDRNNK